MTTQTQTETQTILDMTRRQIRRRAENAVQSFNDDVARNGIAHAIGWGAVPAIVAEMELAELTRFENALGEYGVEKTMEMAAEQRENHQRQADYFDPTNHSTSASSTLTAAAEFKGHRAVVAMFDDLVGSYQMDVDRDAAG